MNCKIPGNARKLNLSEIKKINVGAGPNCNMPAGWYNIDIRKFSGVDIVMDVTKNWGFKELEYIYGEHFLEHLPLEKALEFLENAGNSLKVGGKIRLSTPNLKWVWLTHFRINSKKVDEIVDDTLKVNRAFRGWGHHFLWTDSFLQKALFEMNYINIDFFEYGKSNDKELTNIDQHGGFSKAAGAPSVIIVEATKGEEKIRINPDFKEKITTDFLRYVIAGH